ncbi:hypothetical protein [Aliamphritea spongicola]|nr:hypothetical protein [Aliamphritea spongicola]
MTAQALLQRMDRIKQAVPLRSALYRVMDELYGMANSTAYSVTFTAANNPNTVPVYSAEGYAGYSEDSGHELVGAHVTFKDDLPSFVHELTHARCIQCYKSETVNYAPSGPNTAVMTFGKGRCPVRLPIRFRWSRKVSWPAVRPGTGRTINLFWKGI